MSLPLMIFGITFLVVFVSYFINIHYSIKNQKQQVQNAWMSFDEIIKLRFDEIPQMIQLIIHYLQDDKNILNQVLVARTIYEKAINEDEKIIASQELSLAFNQFLLLIEAKTDIEINDSFIQLKKRILELEKNLGQKKDFYNDTVTNYNMMIEPFPSCLVADVKKHRPMTLYELETQYWPFH